MTFECMCNVNLLLQVYDEEPLSQYLKKSYDQEIHEILLKQKIILPTNRLWFAIQNNDYVFNGIRFYLYASDIVRSRVGENMVLNGFIVKQAITVTLYDFYTNQHCTSVVVFDTSPRFFQDGVSYPRVQLQIVDCGGRSVHVDLRNDLEYIMYKTLKYLVNRKENMYDNDDLEKDCLTYLEDESVLCSLRAMTLIKYCSVYVRKMKGIMRALCNCGGLLLNSDVDKCVCENVRNQCFNLRLFE